MNKKLQIACPICSVKFEYYSSDFRPFCSDRCKQVDLGHWFLEGYKLPSKEPLSDADIEECLKSDQNALDNE